MRAPQGVKIPRFGTFSRDADAGDVVFVPALELGLSARPGARIGGSRAFANLEPLRYGEVAATAEEDKKDAQVRLPPATACGTEALTAPHRGSASCPRCWRRLWTASNAAAA